METTVDSIINSIYYSVRLRYSWSSGVMGIGRYPLAFEVKKIFGTTYRGLFIFPIILIRKDLSDQQKQKTYRHEMAHLYQNLELLLIGQWLWYGIEWLILTNKLGAIFVYPQGFMV